MLALGICLFFTTITLGISGDLDPSFGMSGKVTTTFGDFSQDIAYAVAVQSDGKIVAVGSHHTNVGDVTDTAIIRYNADGTLDNSFDSDGKILIPVSTSYDEAYAVAIQSDGKIVVAGYSFTGGPASYDFSILRFNSNGSLDGSFGNGGIVITDFDSSDETARSIVIQPDGKLVVAGSYRKPNFYDFALARYNTNGTLDNSFGTGGKVTTRLINANVDEIARAIALQADGKIIAAGRASNGVATDSALVRYNSDGSLDMTFDGDGIVITPLSGQDDEINAIVVQPDNKIVTAGYAGVLNQNDDFALVRYNTDGSLDTSFDGDGKVTTAVGSFNDRAYGLCLQPDGKLIAIGNGEFNPSRRFSLVRYSSDGSIDSSFGIGGIVTTIIDNFADYAFAAALLPDGKLIAAGYSSRNVTGDDFALVKYNSSGSLDTSFGSVGRVTSAIREYGDEARAVAIQQDGKIITAGSSMGFNGLDFGLIRYNADGTPDTSFGINGRVSTSLSSGDDAANAVALQSDGKILAAGYKGSFPNADIAVVRFNTNGSRDSGFGINGVVTVVIGSSAETAQSLLVQPDGKIVIAGYAVLPVDMLMKSHFAIVRMDSSGALDTTFDGDGIATTLINNTSSNATTLARQPDGKLVAAGLIISGASSQFALARYQVNGTLDNAFGNAGTVVTAVGNGTSEAAAVAVQADGKIVAAGFDNSSGGTGSDFALVRYDTVGMLDPTFDGDGKVTTAINGNSSDGANAVLVQPGGKIVAVGLSVILSSSNFNIALTRYKSNGSLDSTFGVGGIVTTDWGNFGEAAYGAARQPDGKIVVAGGSNNGTRREFTVLRYLASPNSAFDFDGDGKTDVSVFRPSNGFWYITQSSNNAFRADPFGTNGDLIAPGDFDGDGKTDTTVFRPSNGYWYFIESSSWVFRAIQFGQTGDVPATGDYDGDGKFDIAVFRPSIGIFYFLRSTDGAFQFQQWGQTGDVPVMGDYDGDGKTDFAIFRPSIGTFYILKSSNGGVVGQQFGQSGDNPIAGDFDGDGKTDIAVFRPSTGGWYYLQSSDNSFRGIAWGTSGDLPAAGDYDGDAKWDVAVFRPSTGTFYILQSTNNALRAEQFGTSGDIPVPSAYVP